MTSRSLIATPWDAPALTAWNGRHPLPVSLLGDTDEFAFTGDLAPATPAALDEVQRAAGVLHDELVEGGRVDSATASSFIASRDLASQVQMATPAELLFLHTCPMTLSQRPWAIHVEMLLPMFEPYFGHFRTWDIDLEATPSWHMVRHLVRHPDCRAILTHIRRTQEDLPRLFRDESLTAKVHYAPLGIELDEAARRLAAQAVARKNAREPGDEFTILFTNSWHQDGDSFFKRGGLEAVMGFLLFLEQFPRGRLILRTNLPEQLNDNLRAFLRSHRQLELHEEPVSDAALFQLLARADAFVLPSANLHTISMLRAMAFGAVVVTTDVVAVDEFIAQGETGIVLPGRRGSTYREDREQGLLRERPEPLRVMEANLTAGIGAALLKLAREPEFTTRLRGAARRQVETAHAPGPWRAGFHAMLRACLGRG